MLNGKTLLLTGGTGTFGKAFIKEALNRYKPKKIIVFSRDEFKQFHMQNEFKAYKNKVAFIIGDVRDAQRVRQAVRQTDIVIHAAALKQVPACEENPYEAVQTNIIGAQNICQAAIEAGVSRVIALSTDKAVQPVNLYGATKLASDKIFIAANAQQETTRFSVVRYGNVAGSRGSVIPLFQELAAKGCKKMPITDSRMTRFWIDIEEALELVFKALHEGRGGEIFIAKMPSFKITDLALAVSGSSEVETVGIRAGEKLHEVMIPEQEGFASYEYAGCYIIYPAAAPWWDAGRIAPGGKKTADLFRYASDNNAAWLSVEEIARRLARGKEA